MHSDTRSCTFRFTTPAATPTNGTAPHAYEGNEGSKDGKDEKRKEEERETHRYSTRSWHASFHRLWSVVSGRRSRGGSGRR